MLDGPEIVVLPGAYDALSARLAERAGFAAMFTTGFGFSAAALGMPDFGLLTMSETMDRVRHVVSAVSVPVVADMDTGYGNPLNVQRTVREVIQAGAGGIILEDQEWPKKCGHFEGKRVIAAEDHAAKLRAAIDARTRAERTTW
jgi:methylisocitrate lyase